MKELNFSITIHASASKVYDHMLGITDKKSYEQWTATFNPTSSYEGNWEKGSKMLFVGTDEKGEKGGMVSQIEENIPHSLVIIRHRGLISGGQEVLEGPEVEKWANGLEKYSYLETEGATTVMVSIDAVEEFVDYFNDTYPQALLALKGQIEG